MPSSQRQIANPASENVRALALSLFSLASYAFFYATNILLARTLQVREFDDYNVAVSTVLVLVAIATLGLEKYALRCLPAMQYRQDWSGSRGFMRLSRRFIFYSGVVLTVVLAIGLETTLALRGKDYHVAIVIVAAFLPVIALFQFGLEVVTAYGGELKGGAVYRLLFPALVLGLNLLVWVSPLAFNATSAAVCYGGAWSLAFIVLSIVTQRQVPSPVRKAVPKQRPRKWFRGALPLAANGILLAAFAHTGVIVLELLHPDQIDVSAYAIAFQTGTFIVILSTATNRLYLPKISESLEKKDYRGLQQTLRRRLFLMLPIIAVYLALVFAAGRLFLGFFGAGYLFAYPTLCVVAVGASISTLYSLVPTWLHFVDRSRITLATTTASVVMSIALCFPLCYYYGAFGASLAYAAPVSLLYSGLRLYTVKVYRELMAAQQAD